MRKKSKIMALLLAFAIIFSVFSPVANALTADQVQEDVPATTAVNVVKLVVDAMNETVENNGSELSVDENGNVIVGSRTFSTLPGVEFTVYEVSYEQLEAMKADPTAYQTAAQMDGAGHTALQAITTNTDGVALFNLDSSTPKYYWFIETKAPEGVTAGLAVPFGLSLPMTNTEAVTKDGVEILAGTAYLNTVYAYPKNTTGTPKTDKQIIGAEDQKAPQEYNIGDVVPFEISTMIPAGKDYKTYKWHDTMSAGLELVQEMVVKIGDTIVGTNEYTVTYTTDGFELELTEAGRALLNNQSSPTDVSITYGAVLTEDAVMDVTENNSMVFEYGNGPGHETESEPVTPKNGEITVKKAFVGPQPPASITFELVLDGSVVETVELNASNGWSHTWTNLTGTGYVVREVMPEGVDYSVDYTVNGAVVDVVNYNPNTTTDPIEREVITYGKKFVKQDESTKTGLEGAEFIITNGADPLNYLAEKSTEVQAADQAAYVAAEKAYQDAVLATSPDVDTLLAARDAAQIAAAEKYYWTANKAEALTLTSAADGSFEIKGLVTGTYYLVETKAPDGYALNEAPIEFKVGPGTYAGMQSEGVSFDGHSAAGQQIINNRNLTIPQTGGMGTIIFVVAGLVIMGTAVVVMKKRQELDV